MRSDAELYADWRAGDERAGNELFERHFDALYRFFRNKLESGAEDLVQQTFLACVASEEGFRGDASFRTFLFTVARSKLYDHLRVQRRKHGNWDPLEFSVAASGASPSLLLADREEQRILFEALNRIPLELQLAVELFYFEDLPASEVARVLEVPEGTVRSRVRRALALLREYVQREARSAEAASETLSLVEQVERKLG